MAERVNTTVTSLLGLLGINADPIKSREQVVQRRRQLKAIARLFGRSPNRFYASTKARIASAHQAS